MRPEDVIPTLTSLGFGEADARTLADHFLDSEARGKRGHGLSRVEWLARLPEQATLVVAQRCFPTGALGYWARKLAEGGLVCVLTATSPPRLGHPDGGPKLTGTNPLAIAIPSSDGKPVVSDVSMGRVTYGEVIAGDAGEGELVPFGGEQAHKAFALAVGLQLLVDSLVAEPG